MSEPKETGCTTEVQLVGAPLKKRHIRMLYTDMAFYSVDLSYKWS